MLAGVQARAAQIQLAAGMEAQAQAQEVNVLSEAKFKASQMQQQAKQVQETVQDKFSETRASVQSQVMAEAGRMGLLCAPEVSQKVAQMNVLAEAHAKAAQVEAQATHMLLVTDQQVQAKAAQVQVLAEMQEQAAQVKALASVHALAVTVGVPETTSSTPVLEATVQALSNQLSQVQSERTATPAASPTSPYGALLPVPLPDPMRITRLPSIPAPVSPRVETPNIGSSSSSSHAGPAPSMPAWTPSLDLHNQRAMPNVWGLSARQPFAGTSPINAAIRPLPLHPPAPSSAVSMLAVRQRQSSIDTDGRYDASSSPERSTSPPSSPSLGSSTVLEAFGNVSISNLSVSACPTEEEHWMPDDEPEDEDEVEDAHSGLEEEEVAALQDAPALDLEAFENVLESGTVSVTAYTQLLEYARNADRKTRDLNIQMVEQQQLWRELLMEREHKSKSLQASLRDKAAETSDLKGEVRTLKNGVLSQEGEYFPPRRQVSQLSKEGIAELVERLDSYNSMVREVQQDKMKCVVCLDRLAQIIVLPCRHQVLCGECAKDLNDCPMCRAHIDQKIEPFS